MKALLQRVKSASVEVNSKQVSSIGAGLLVFLGIEKDDTPSNASYLCQKIQNLRIFEDENGKMNKSVKDIDGSILVVSQFTLAADTSRGNRPGFETAARPQEANELYNFFVETLSKDVNVKTGIFQADMQVSLINDGPATFMLEKR